MSTANPFWEFSLAVYGKPGVAEACLRLQDNAGLDVNLLLYCGWIATVRETPMTEAEMRNVVMLTREWREQVVSPLREIRRGLKSGADGIPANAVESFRSDVKRLELASERLQQDMLFGRTAAATALPCDPAAVARCAEENIALYLSVMSVAATSALLDDCRCIAGAAVQLQD